MKDTRSTAKRRPLDITALLGRWLLGGLFLYLGVSKVLHPAEFVRLVRVELAIANPSLSSLIITTVPWLEVLYGLVLLSGIAKNAAERSLVTKLTTDIDGVSSVVNNMTIDTTLSKN